MAAYYNEIDPYAAQWLRNLIAGGHIAPGEVDERSIEDVTPDDLRGFTQCHFFAGIGVWSHSLRLAGWPDDKPVWTGSCPCQPFSAAGKGDGFADERHLWPHFFHLISECRPKHVFGEQVAAGNANAWFDLVQADLEGVGYAFGLVPFTSAGIGAPHIRERPTGWPTPVANTNPQPETKRGLQHVSGAARLTGWQTPVANDSTGSTHCYSGKNQDGSPKICMKLPGSVILAAWPTPTASDYKGSGKTVIRSDGKDRTFDRLDYAAEQGVIVPLRLTVFGEMRTGSYVEMANGVQLNPAHSRWLQGLPKAWDTASPHYEQWQAATAQADLRVTATP
nr:MAG TPA: Cytosine specific methyltransferase [Caudoviricetes sp.]